MKNDLLNNIIYHFLLDQELIYTVNSLGLFFTFVIDIKNSIKIINYKTSKLKELYEEKNNFSRLFIKYWNIIIIKYWKKI